MRRLPHDSLAGTIAVGITLTVVLYLVVRVLITGA